MQKTVHCNNERNRIARTLFLQRVPPKTFLHLCRKRVLAIRFRSMLAVPLVVVTIFCHVLDLYFKIPADWINFSGQKVITYHYYVLITSSFFHGTTSHLFKEVTLVLPLAVITEQETGSIWFLCYYFLFGAVGSLLTWLTDRWMYSKMYPDGLLIADLIWSRGASGNVYGLCSFTSILFGDHYLFQNLQSHILNYKLDAVNCGMIWCLVTNVLFRTLNRKSHFRHNPWTAYPVLIAFSIGVLYIFPQRLTVNQYLIIYFIHMSLSRRNPGIFNKIDGSGFIASDYKCHLFSAVFGWFIAVGIKMDAPSIWNMIPSLSILLADGYYGQYAVQQRMRRNRDEKRKREEKRTDNAVA